MSSKIRNKHFSPADFKIFLLTLALAVGLAAVPSMAVNLVDIRANTIEDTIGVGFASSFDIYIENDIVLGGINLGFRVWSPDGAIWIWNRTCTNGSSLFCVVPGSRADGCVWDVTGLQIIEQDVDEISPDTIGLAGTAMSCGLQPGPLEHMYSAHFTPGDPGYGEVSTLCIDSVFIPPSGAFVFVDQIGASFPPIAAWESGGRCWPVANVHPCHVEWDWNLPTSITIAHCEVGIVTLSIVATCPQGMTVQFRLEQFVGGSGTASLIDNGDGTCEVIYYPVPDDVGQPIHIVIDATCGHTPFGHSSPFDLSVNVTNDPPALDPGFYYKWGATNNLLVIDDIIVVDNDACDNPEFFIVSGPGQIDPVTGLYTWMPGPGDSGVYIIEFGVTDNCDTALGSYQAGISDENCCPGDANYSGTINVGDAVFLVNYIFKGGSPPLIMNWGDPNADCEINVGDVVYLINYVFRSGDDPQVGCFY
jgi:hypothetical protein